MQACLTSGMNIRVVESQLYVEGYHILLSTNNHHVTPTDQVLAYWNRFYFAKPDITIEPLFHSITRIILVEQGVSPLCQKLIRCESESTCSMTF